MSHLRLEGELQTALALLEQARTLAAHWERSYREEARRARSLEDELRQLRDRDLPVLGVDLGTEAKGAA